jgi:predicted SAM-dependent methyltransferase
VLRAIAYVVAPFRWVQYATSGFAGSRLHIGCGTVRLNGWINADIDPRADLILDIGMPLPFRSGRFDRIYSEHVLEHLKPDVAARFLREARRILAPSGVLRIAMPDLGRVVSGYDAGWREFDWVSWPEYEFLETRAQMINVSFRWWGHKWLYDAEELEASLRRAGFSEIRFEVNGRSQHQDLRGLETRADSTLIVEATK